MSEGGLEPNGRHEPMQIRYHCPTDGCVAIIEYEPLAQCGETMECPRCHTRHRTTVSGAMRNDDMVDRCAICNGTELFIRKDFPQALGLGVVIVFGLIALYYFTVSVVIAWGVLAAAVALDLVVYALVGRVTICYACRAEYRKCKLNPAHDGFDLATSEKY